MSGVALYRIAKFQKLFQSQQGITPVHMKNPGDSLTGIVIPGAFAVAAAASLVYGLSSMYRGKNKKN